MGDRFALAGRVWEVEELDIARKLIYVKQVKGKMEISWPGDYGEIHTKILEKMREILLCDEEYPYLKPQAKERLASARAIARNTGFAVRPVVRLGGFSYCIFPWLGTRAFRTLRRTLLRFSKDLGVSAVEFEGCYYISFKMERTTEEEFFPRLVELIEKNGGLDPEELVFRSETPCTDKYDSLIPPSLLRKVYAHDRLDSETALRRINEFAELS